MADYDPHKPWYHGSPQKLTELLVGSTITQDLTLARIFSHKPTCVSTGDWLHFEHNGKANGFLHIVAEAIQPEDIVPVPNSFMPPGKEWHTTREIKIEFLEETCLVGEELLSEAEIAELKAEAATSNSSD